MESAHRSCLKKFLIEMSNGLSDIVAAVEKGNIMKLSTIILAIAFAAPSTLALAGPMNLADPILVPSQSSTWHDHTTTWQAYQGSFQKYPRLRQMVHAGRH
jgi:hypothetical protein